jgi:hypothetical protein
VFDCLFLLHYSVQLLLTFHFRCCAINPQCYVMACGTRLQTVQKKAENFETTVSDCVLNFELTP